MAVIDLVLGLLKVVTIVYDIVTFPIYGITQQSWKERTKQNLGAVSILHFKFIRRHQIFLGGPRTKMKKSSENFWRASGAQKKGFPNFSPAPGFFSLWRH